MSSNIESAAFDMHESLQAVKALHFLAREDKPGIGRALLRLNSS
jgi:hypothetical protein